MRVCAYVRRLLVRFSGAVARVLLFNTSGDRDAAAMLKLLLVSPPRTVPSFVSVISQQGLNASMCFQPCHFHFAVFCPNISEAVASGSAGKSASPPALRQPPPPLLSSLFRPTELQRVGGEHANALPGQPEELAAAQPGRSSAPDPGELVAGAPPGGPHAGLPLHPQRPPVDGSGQGRGASAFAGANQSQRAATRRR